MAITRVKKGEIVEKLKKVFKEVKSLVFVNFHGLGVVKVTLMRRELKSEGISYLVAKKTLVSRAIGEEKFEGAMPALDGELALVWGEDLVAPARGIYAFQKKFPEIKIMGGVFDGHFMTAIEMEEIAQIPTLKVLRGQFVHIINSPIQSWVSVLGQMAERKN